MTAVPLGLSHPATYSKPILDRFQEILDRELTTGFKSPFRVLDPFGGIGKIHLLHTALVETCAVEIEPEWVALDPTRRTIQGDATALPKNWTGQFAMVMTSPAYGNRFSDRHMPKDASRRRGYTFDLRRLTGNTERQLHPNNTGGYGFHTPQYKTLHQQAWREAWRVLSKKGKLVLNVSDFIAKNEVVDVVGWHRDALVDIGFDLVEEHRVETRRLRYGTNHTARVAHEVVYVFQRS